MMAKLHNVEGRPWMKMFQCPGCGNCHYFNASTPGDRNGPVWAWNGSMDKPTFSPSLLVRGVKSFDDPTPTVCHSFVADGRIQYLGDCTHALAGQTVEIPEWEA